jgi:predicted flap endonuclease-1-like 5' DNA nuclease
VPALRHGGSTVRQYTGTPHSHAGATTFTESLLTFRLQRDGMRVVLTDGTEIHCRNFRAIDSGVLLTEDEKRKRVVGFVPHHQLRYVLAAELTATDPAGAAEADDGGDGDDTADAAGPPADRAVDADTDTDTGEQSAETDVEPVRVEPSGDADATDESDLRRLGGVGSTYADRLRSAGYESLADLVGADPVAVAEAASVPPGRGRRWVEAARQVTGPRSRSASKSTDDGRDGVESREDAEPGSPEGTESGDENVTVAGDDASGDEDATVAEDETAERRDDTGE